jgi:hypothetical protein
MNEPQALRALADIEAVCKKHGLFYTIEQQKRPELKFITVKDITIKITEASK